MKYLFPIATFLLMTGCTSPTEPPLAYFPPEMFPDDGLVKREPDSCGASDFAGLIGKSEGMLRTVVLTGPYRVVPFGSLVTQDYNPLRINFRLDETGSIATIICG